MNLNLELNIKPQAHQSFRIGRNGIKYKPKKIKDYQKEVCLLVKQQIPKDFNIIEAGTQIEILELVYQFEYLKATPKKNRIQGTPKVTKPDLQDNLNKAFLDALEGLIYEQDQNIVSINNLKKCYGETNKITLKIKY